MDKQTRKILVTGAAGFIGAAVCHRLLQNGDTVVGLDNINDYYDTELKFGRLTELGIDRNMVEWFKFIHSSRYARFEFVRMNLEDRQAVRMLFANGEFDAVVNLGAQAGVRYSIENPSTYIESNVDGFLNVLEGCRHNNVKHLVYASSSSVYGMNGKTPFSEHDNVDHPVSLYAATKRSNELMAHAYSKLFDIPVTGLRFFTVYGPWGRPDMSPFLFIDAALHNRPIKVFNNGDMLRDFTYIDDIVESVVRILDIVPKGDPQWNSLDPDPAMSSVPYRIYNVGNQQPVKLMDYIECIEKTVGREIAKEYLPMQQGDVYQTYADSSALADATGFKPSTPLETGIERTVTWFRSFYNL